MTLNLFKEQSITKNIIKKWFWLYFFWYLSAPLWYIIRVIISNSSEVSVSELWTLYGIISFITILYTYNDLWLTESLQYFLPKFFIKKNYDSIRTVVYFSLFVQIITWIIIALILRFSSDLIAVKYFHSSEASEILKYFCFYFFSMNILQVIQTLFKAFQRTFELQFTEFIRAFSILVFTFYFFINWWWIGEFSLSRLRWIFIALIFALILYLRFRKTIIKWSFILSTKDLKSYTKYALWALIGSSIWNLFGQIILQMVIYLLWTEQAWYYSNFLSLFYIWHSILWPIIVLIFPLTSEYFEKTDKRKINYVLSLFYTYFTIFIASLSTFFAIFWPEIAVALFWEKYLYSWNLLSISWFFLIFNLLTSFNYAILAWLWKVRERVYITWITCLITIIISYIWIYLWWLYWACISFWISNLCTRYLSFFLIKKEKYQIKLNKIFIIINILSLIFLGILFVVIKKYISFQDRFSVIIYLISALFLFYSTLSIINMEKIKNIKKLIF